jgi:hypothetical protein
MDKPTCESCVYWEHLGPGTGFCHCRPPHPYDGNGDQWPRVGGDEYCGSHPQFPAYLDSLKKSPPKQVVCFKCGHLCDTDNVDVGKPCPRTDCKGTMLLVERIKDFPLHMCPECQEKTDHCLDCQELKKKHPHFPPHETEEYPCRCFIVDGHIHGPLDDHTDTICQDLLGLPFPTEDFSERTAKAERHFICQSCKREFKGYSRDGYCDYCYHPGGPGALND